jgi:hypothetical protein
MTAVLDSQMWISPIWSNDCEDILLRAALQPLQEGIHTNAERCHIAYSNTYMLYNITMKLEGEESMVAHKTFHSQANFQGCKTQLKWLKWRLIKNWLPHQCCDIAIKCWHTIQSDEKVNNCSLHTGKVCKCWVYRIDQQAFFFVLIILHICFTLKESINKHSFFCLSIVHSFYATHTS